MRYAMNNITHSTKSNAYTNNKNQCIITKLGLGGSQIPCRLNGEEMNTYRLREPNPSCQANSLLATPTELVSAS
jgi:hypothetical protein